MKRKLIAIFIFMISFSAFSLEMKNGRIKLVINEQTARFSLYYMTDLTRNIYVPLLYDQESRTTFPSIIIDGKIFRLGESAEYRFKINKKDNETIIEYKSSFCIIRQIFSFVSATASENADGVSIKFEMENISKNDINLGLRFLLDTYLGEKTSIHFATQENAKYTSEFEFSGQYKETWFSTPSTNFEGLYVILDGKIATKPNRVIFANWKRLYDTNWSMELSPTRDFSIYPYSVNDSAAALYYDPEKLKKGEIRKINVILGINPPQDYSQPIPVTKSNSETNKKEEEIVIVPQTIQNRNKYDIIEMETDLSTVKNLLKIIQDHLDSGAALTAEELLEIRLILDQLNKKKENY